MMEHWKPIIGYEGLYDISDHGRVRTWMLRTGSRVTKRSEPMIMKTQPADPKNKDYRNILLRKDRKSRAFLIHRLVLTHFVGPCPPGHQGAHDDGIPSHNWLSNLAWKTPKSNHADKKRHGTSQHGERCSKHRLTEGQVREILADNRRTPGSKLAKRYGVNHTAIYAILRGKTWGHLLPTEIADG